MTLSYNNIMLRHGYLPMWYDGTESQFNMTSIATVAMNFSHYGYSVDAAAMKALMKLNEGQLIQWWRAIESELKDITGANRKMADFVVYKNFPAECLEMSQAEYWLKQICIYWGVAGELTAELMAEEVKPREGMSEAPQCKVLRLEKPGILHSILNNKVAQTARWKREEKEDALFMAKSLKVDFGSFGFKENLVTMVKEFIKDGKPATVNTATDVLRLAAGLSDGDVSLREKVRFSKFNRKTRRFLLNTLEGCRNLMEDVARRPETFKRLFKCLHPFDYIKRYPRTCEVANALYKGNLLTFNSLVEYALANKDQEALELLATRPGEFRRRLVHCMDLFGKRAVEAFISKKVLNNLTVSQLVSTRRYLCTASTRKTRMIPPKGNWSKVQLMKARNPSKVLATRIMLALDAELGRRVPSIKNLDIRSEYIKLPSNDGEVSPYARGTAFPIPKNVKFIRTASYWKAGRFDTIWFDNGINFFDSAWNSNGTLCWDSSINDKAAVFSGDPVSGYKKSACQMIDMYPDKLLEKGIRYCVWNLLCYSHVTFDQVDEVHASLQWGDEPQKGELFEPSRAQLSFPIKGSSKTKFVCYIDLKLMEMVYMDANLPGYVHSASANASILSEMMPAYVEYLNSLPSVYDLFNSSVDKKEGHGHVLYTDKCTTIKGTKEKPELAYVFRPENEANSYQELDINALLSK